MLLRLFRGALAAVTMAVSIPYTVAIVSNILNGWPQRKDKYSRALNPRKVFGLNYVLCQMIKDKSKFIFLYLKWRQFYRNADPQKICKNIPFGRNDCCLDVYLSKHKKKAPVIIFVYGGSWSSGDRSMYGMLADQLVSRTKSVVVCPSYSTYPKGYVDDMVQDIVDCIRWVVENIEQFNGDPNSIVLMGHSAGAHLCALTILELLRDQLLSVDNSFKFDPEESVEQLEFAESHYGRLGLFDKQKEGLEDSSGSSESFAVVSDNGSMADNNGSNNGLESSTASSLGFLSANINLEALESSTSSEGFVKAKIDDCSEMEGREFVATDAAETTNTGDPGEMDRGDNAIQSVKKDDDRTPADVHVSDSGSLGDDEEEDDDSCDNDSIVTVKPKDIDRQATLSDLFKSIKAFIGLGGVYSIADHFQHEMTRGIEDVSCMSRAFYGEDHFEKFSPLEMIERVESCLSLPQMVLVHGTADYIVPPTSSSKFAEALSKVSANVQLRLIPDCPHYEICLELMDAERKFYNQVMSIVLETFNGIS